MSVVDMEIWAKKMEVIKDGIIMTVIAYVIIKIGR